MQYGWLMAPPSPVTDAVRRLFKTTDRHALSMDELHRSARAALGRADYSTVFRAVVGLEKQGLVDRLDLGDGRLRFEIRDDHHEHVRWSCCGEVAEVVLKRAKG